MTIEEKKQKYIELCHAMQAGVAIKMQIETSDTSPKQLRVGINSAMVSHSALVNLLIAKGIFTEDEYWDALIVAMAHEVDLYESEIKDLYGGKTGITLV